MLILEVVDCLAGTSTLFVFVRRLGVHELVPKAISIFIRGAFLHNILFAVIGELVDDVFYGLLDLELLQRRNALWRNGDAEGTN